MRRQRRRIDAERAQKLGGIGAGQLESNLDVLQLVWVADAAGSDDPRLPRLDPGVDGIASVWPLLAFAPPA